MAAIAEGSSGRVTIVFIGFMAAGKSTAAHVLAERLGVAAHDSDEIVAQAAGMTVAEIFEREGEASFRQREESAVLSLLESDAQVVAVGGGAIESARVREALALHLPVWCEIDEPTAWERASADDHTRPLTADRFEFSRRFAERAPRY
ncbi:MAG: 3-dehydroquinate synthase, partial [Actinomycetota bacterium]|nr:3-dehydroquinate synthase [Actinomycetota bacterium]